MNKKLNIILLVLVMCLWGTVIYRYVNNFFFLNKEITLLDNTILYKEATIKVKDTFALVPLKRDPFLNKNYAPSAPISVSNNSRSRVSKSSLSKPKKENTPILTFPSISYLGYIKSTSSSSELVLLKINNKLTRLRNNEIKEGIKVVKIFKDSVLIVYGKTSKIIKKGK